MNKYLKETILWALIAVPFVYLAMLWNLLPEQVPTHFNANGIPDDWSSKSSLIYLECSLGIGVYGLMLLIPYLDPKKRIREMGDKYYALRFLFTFFFCLLGTYLIYVTREGSLKHPGMLMALISVLLAFLGNYFQALRPNYFIGIRTPWTLESETVWKKTHRLAGRLWMAGGITGAVLAFVITDSAMLEMVFGALLFVLVIVPVVFSYLEFRKEKTQL
jgi:uncharacterized membrane protein